MSRIGFLVLLVVAITTAIPLEQFVYEPEDLYGFDSTEEEVQELQRSRRSLQPGAPNFPAPGGQQPSGGWSVNPNVERDNNGNTRTSINVQQKGKNHEINGGWDKVVRGPGKAKPTWHVGGTFKW